MPVVHSSDKYRRFNSERRHGRLTAEEESRIWPLVIQMYRQGHTDIDIAEAVGLSSAAIYRWRKRTHRERN